MAEEETSVEETKKGASENGFNWNALFAVVMAAVVWLIAYFCGWCSNWWQTIVILLLCYPWKIGNDVWSLFGGINRHGSIYSLFGVYQDARERAIQFGGLCLFQRGGVVAVQFLGFCVFQKGKDVYQNLGLCLAQTAEGNVFHGLGLCVHQDAKGDAVQLVGVCIFQLAERCAWQIIGFCPLQIGKKRVEQIIGLCLMQCSFVFARHGCGLCLIQEAKECVSWPLSVVVWRNVLPCY